MQIGDIIEGHYSAEQTAQLAALNAHWTEIEPRHETAPRRTIRRWRVDANPPAPGPTPEELAAQKQAEKTARFNEIDAASIRAIRAIVAGVGTDDDRARLTALENEAIRLRGE